MKILILGGTVFLGRYLVEAAQHRGHEVTLFNRGVNNSHLYPYVEKLRGDRRGSYDALNNRRWDAVIDTSCYHPSVARSTLEHLKNSAGHYTFISSVSVYNNLLDPVESKEEDPTKEISDKELKTAEGLGTEDEGFDNYYGALKAKCEKVFSSEISDKLLIVRPGLIAGAYDNSDRFTYWPKRISEGGKVMAPGSPDTRMTVIDASDLAIWNIKMLETKTSGIFNITGQYGQLTYKSFFEHCRDISKSDAEFIWMEDEFLNKYNLMSFSKLPYYLSRKYSGLFHINIDKALKNRLEFRPIADTISDTLSWIKERDSYAKLKVGISKKLEQQIIKTYLNRKTV